MNGTTLKLLLLLPLTAATALLPAEAANPGSGILTDTSGPVLYDAGPFNIPNPTPIPLIDSGPECNGTAQPCDDFALTVSLPAGYAAAHPGELIQVSLSWTDAGAGEGIQCLAGWWRQPGARRA